MYCLVDDNPMLYAIGNKSLGKISLGSLGKAWIQLAVEVLVLFCIDIHKDHALLVDDLQMELLGLFLGRNIRGDKKS